MDTAHADPESAALLDRCGRLGSAQDVAALRADVAAFVARRAEPRERSDLPDLPEAAALTLRYLVLSVTDVPAIGPEPLADALESDDTALANAAALCFVHRLADDRTAQRSLLLGACAHGEPSLGRNARQILVRMMGWSRDPRFAGLLDEILRHHYHFHRPDLTAESLALVGAPADPQEVPFARSISVFEGGSRLLIHRDDRFGGSSNCPQCRYFPCRINEYYRGAIEDCKLHDRLDPDSFHELVDHREEAATDPATRGLGEWEKRKRTRELLRLASESETGGDLAAAAEALRRAVRFAAGPDEQLDLVARGVRLKVQAGDRTGAFALLQRSKDVRREAWDRAVIRRFEAAILGLEEELGGYVDPVRRSLTSAKSKELARLYQRLRRPPGTEPTEIRDRLREIDRQLEHLHREGLDPSWWLRRLVSLAHLSGDHEIAERWVSRLFHRAPADDSETLLRDATRARLCGYRGDRAGALDRFADLLGRVRRAPHPERRLEWFGDHLEALGRAAEQGTAPEAELVVGLARKVRDLFRDLLAEQPGSASRRRLRQRHQRTLENGLFGLLLTARLAGLDTPVGQALLAESWRLTMVGRHPELQAARPRPPREHAARLGNLEDVLHRSLSYMLIRGKIHWRLSEVPDALRDVVDFELSTTEPARRPEEGDRSPPRAGRAIATFVMRNRVAAETLVVLIHHQGRFGLRWIEDARTSLLDPLDRWTRSVVGKPGTTLREWDGLQALATTLSRDFDVAIPPAPDDPEVPGPGELRTLAARALPEVRSPSGNAGSAETWYLLTDEPFTRLPIELLPQADGGAPLFESVTVRQCLRSAPRLDSTDRTVDLNKGWLGVGDVPAAGKFAALPETRGEVEGIAADLERAGFEARCLLGAEAHLGRLTELLESRRPAVLHFACHGYADVEYPDASCLVLAVEPGGAAGELLPFRSIRDLPLDGVELVVLAACSSLVGPDLMGAEGLAWAFLDAGVPRVLASRGRVKDGTTGRLMRHFYRHLLHLPVAEALRRTRVDARRNATYSPADLAMWCLWE